MNKIYGYLKKKAYAAPTINRIELDNEISLALESDPESSPDGDPIFTQANSCFSNDPFKNLT